MQQTVQQLHAVRDAWYMLKNCTMLGSSAYNKHCSALISSSLLQSKRPDDIDPPIVYSVVNPYMSPAQPENMFSQNPLPHCTTFIPNLQSLYSTISLPLLTRRPGARGKTCACSTKTVHMPTPHKRLIQRLKLFIDQHREYLAALEENCR